MENPLETSNKVFSSSFVMTNDFVLAMRHLFFQAKDNSLLAKSLSRVRIVFFILLAAKTILRFVDTTAIVHQIMRVKSHLYATVSRASVHSSQSSH